MNALEANSDQTMEKFIEKLSINIREEREIPSTRTGDTIPWYRFSPRDWAKEKFYPRDCPLTEACVRHELKKAVW